MEPDIRSKIEQTVIQVLKEANLEEATEFKVRVAASERLGVDLSGSEQKQLVRGVVEAFLLSTAEDGARENVPPAEVNVREETKEVVQEEGVDCDGNRIICKLSNKRSVTVQEFKGKSYVSIREYYQKDGRQLPSNKGINLSSEQWSTFKNSVPAIEDAIKKLQSKLRSDVGGEQSEQVSNGMAASIPHEPVPNQINHVKEKNDHNLMTASTPCEFFPIEINRFDGKNYHSWAQHMESFLKQLEIAYVLTDPCPGIAISPEATSEVIAQAKAVEQKWFSDDYMCRYNILNSLSDSLYYQYSKKSESAKELWEELKLVYLHEEFGTKRSQVKKYVEFQIVDEKPIFDQVQELNNIADAIVSAGILIDENFHVSTVISKLPSSWKDFCMKLMREEHLPFWMLMEHVRVEEESRSRSKQREPSHSMYFHHATNFGPMMREMTKPGFNWRRRETEVDNKTYSCNFCRKKGHLSKNCWNKKFDKGSNWQR